MDRHHGMAWHIWSQHMDGGHTGLDLGNGLDMVLRDTDRVEDNSVMMMSQSFNLICPCVIVY